MLGNHGHFDYKNDLSWTPEMDVNSELISSYLTLDIDKLAESLKCIPLHERLGLDDSFFTVSFIFILVILI